MMPLVPYGSLGLNERPMLLLWVECGTLVFCFGGGMVDAAHSKCVTCRV